MARFASVVLVLALGCATVAPASRVDPVMARIAALEDARTTGDGELVAFASDKGPRVRARCATALGRMPFPEKGSEVTRALLTLLRDPDPSVRAAAAFALGMRGDSQAADKLVFAAFDYHEADPDPLVRARAVEAASKLDRPELRARLLDGLDDVDARVRLEAAAAPVRWPADEAIDRRLVEHVKGEQDRDVILYALSSLERRKAKVALEVFDEFSSDRDDELRLFAVRGLKALAPDPAAVAALGRASADRDWRIVCEALLGLGAASDAAALKHLAGAAAHPSPHVRRCAWEAFGAAVDGIDDAQRLARAFDDFYRAVGVREVTGLPGAEPCESVRAAILETQWLVLLQSERLDPDASLEPLGTSHVDPIEMAWRPASERSAIARVAARSPDSSAARELLFHLARERDVTLRQSLANIVGTKELPPDQRARIDEAFAYLDAPQDLVVRETAIEALAKHPGDGTRAFLHELLADPDNGIRLGAVLALAEMPDASDLEPLSRCYDSSSGDGANEIRFNVLRAAARCAGESSWPLLTNAVVDPNPFVRRVAREELVKLDPGSKERVEALAAEVPPREVVELELPHYDTDPIIEVVTSKGALRFELFPDEAPLHVFNFLTLAARNHYDGTPWHRVVPDFVIQGGDRRGDGNGGGTWRGAADSLRHEISPRKYVRGSLGMPRNEDFDSGGSQIFVTHRATPHLDGRYTIFGELRDGFEVLDAIEVGDTLLGVRRLR